MSSSTVSVRDARASESDRRWIQSVYRDYLDDLAPDTGVFPVLGEVGHREPDQIHRWFGEAVINKDRYAIIDWVVAVDARSRPFHDRQTLAPEGPEGPAAGYRPGQIRQAGFGAPQNAHPDQPGVGTSPDHPQR